MEGYSYPYRCFMQTSPALYNYIFKQCKILFGGKSLAVFLLKNSVIEV